MSNLSVSGDAYENDIFIKKCRNIIADYEKQEYEVDLNDYGDCKSPIERVLWGALRTIQKINNIPISEPCDCPPCQTSETHHLTQGICIDTQIKFDNYRVDFLLYHTWINWKTIPNKYLESKLIIEADSQQWHERTEKERRYEKKRDRYLLSKGYNVVHYTGKEILEFPFETAVEILTLLTKDCYYQHIEQCYWWSEEDE